MKLHRDLPAGTTLVFATNAKIRICLTEDMRDDWAACVHVRKDG